MGGPMAMRLLQANYSLLVNSRTRARATQLMDRGATWVNTPKKLAQDCDLVLICVTDTPDVEKIICGPDGIVESARPGLVVIDHSTISPAATRAMADKLAEKGTILLDAPLSGGDIGAKNGTLSMMVGGERATLERIEGVLRNLATTITYCGPSGCGQLTKMVNQILVSVTNLAVCEALTFARKNGLDLDKTIQALAAGAAGSWQLANLGPRMAMGDFRPGFTINLQQKDLRLVLTAAEDAKTSLPAVSLAHQLFTAAQAAGHGKDGTQALFTVVEKLASIH